MPRLVSFKKPNEEVIWINPLLVQYVERYGTNGMFSVVQFDEDHEGAVVEGAPDEVARQLEAGLNYHPNPLSD